MVTGALIMESLRPGCALDASDLTFTSIERCEVDGVTADQPSRWTVAQFVGDIPDPGELAARLAEVLDSPGWYVDFRNDDAVWVVFPQRVFTYARDDRRGRQQAIDYALSIGVPPSQTDWSD